MMLPIFIGSHNDRRHMWKGLAYLDEKRAYYRIIEISVHRAPDHALTAMKEVFRDPVKINAVIAGARCAAGLPGVIAGYVHEKNLSIPVIGVRFTPGLSAIPEDEDRSFGLSELPTDPGPILIYAGHNADGFLRACKQAAWIKGFRL